MFVGAHLGPPHPEGAAEQHGVRLPRPAESRSRCTSAARRRGCVCRGCQSRNWASLGSRSEFLANSTRPGSDDGHRVAHGRNLVLNEHALVLPRHTDPTRQRGPALCSGFPSLARRVRNWLICGFAGCLEFGSQLFIINFDRLVPATLPSYPKAGIRRGAFCGPGIAYPPGNFRGST